MPCHGRAIREGVPICVPWFGGRDAYLGQSAVAGDDLRDVWDSKPAIQLGDCSCKIHYFLPSCSFAAVTTQSGSKPNFLWSSLSGAEAPNVFMPMTRPDSPT
jgi:hypothetical protein